MSRSSNGEHTVPTSGAAEQVLASLRQRGERLTPQRRAMIEALCAQPTHLTTADLLEALRERGVDLNEPTVYRILQWLKDVGMVSQTDLGGSGIVYQIMVGPRHHHLVCLNCGRVQDVDDALMDGLREQLRSRYGFEPRIDHMAFFGLCRACQAESETHTQR